MSWLNNQLLECSTLQPIDMIEEFGNAHRWQMNRLASDELSAGLVGRWSDYTLYFLWQEDLGSLYFSLSLDSKIPEHRLLDAYALISMVNSKLWLGHFEISPDDRSLVFRHTLSLRSMGVKTVEIIEDVLDTAIVETEQFYPAFQYMIWGGKSPEEALEAAEFEFIGEQS